jgi:hypothetical protein
MFHQWCKATGTGPQEGLFGFFLTDILPTMLGSSANQPASGSVPNSSGSFDGAVFAHCAAVPSFASL